MSDLSQLQSSLLGINIGLGAYDWNETRRRVGEKGGTEYSPLLGKKPGPDKINEHFAGVAAAGIAGLNALPDKLKTSALIGSGLLQLANLDGRIWGNPSMLKAHDENSIKIAALGALMGYAMNGSKGQVIVDAKRDKNNAVNLLLGYKTDF